MNKLVDIMTFSHSVQRFYLVSAIVVIVTLAILVPSPSSAYQPPIVPRLDIVTSDYELSYHEGVRAIDLKGNTTLHLKCQGHSPMSWSFPQIFWVSARRDDIFAANPLLNLINTARPSRQRDATKP